MRLCGSFISIIGILTMAMLLTSCNKSRFVSGGENHSSAINQRYQVDNVQLTSEELNVAKQLCVDAYQEYYRAVASKVNGEFEPFIASQPLIKYMQYNVEMALIDYGAGDEVDFTIQESDFTDDYIYIVVNSEVNSVRSSARQISKFLVKDIDAKLQIVEWYVDDPMSSDVNLRGDFSIQNNLDYWDSPDKYKPIIEWLGIEP